MDVVIVGSVALDSVEAPKGSVERALGGAAVYASVAASYVAKAGIVGVVGGDFPKEHLRKLRRRGIDLEGLEIIPDGKTFFWRGRYELDINYRTTLETQLNVFETFSPKLPESYCCSRPYLLLGNIHPSLQMDVLNKVAEPRLVLCDTMNLWIEIERPTLMKLLKRVDILCVNDSEARQLSGKTSIPAAAEWILARGPSRVIVKRGEHGVSHFGPEGMFSIPAYPVAKPVDPTGAGDSFAGGFIGYLASRRKVNEAAMRQALVFGSVMASFCVENFSLGSLFKLKGPEIAERCEVFHRATQFKPFKLRNWKE